MAAQGYHKHHLSKWLQDSGYNTYYVGKLYNGHTVQNYNKPYAQGFNGSEFLLDPFTYQYYNSSFSRNGESPINHAGQYSTDLIANKSAEFLEDALRDSSRPFFLTAAPASPHSNMVPPSSPDEKLVVTPPPSAKRHAHLFSDYKIPRTDNFNPDHPSGANWIAKLPRLNNTVIEWNDDYQRDRLRALQAVDELVGSLGTQKALYSMLTDSRKARQGGCVGQHLFPV